MSLQWSGNPGAISVAVNFARSSSMLQTSQGPEDSAATADHSERQSARRQQNYKKKVEKNPFKFFLIRRHLHWGYFQRWNDWQLRSHSCQLSIKLSKHRSYQAGLPGAKHIKALASPSLPEGHNSSACQNPCEFTFYSKLHVPAAQCDTIRSWLCVNQMMTAWPCGCLALCHSLVANPLPRESGNWFPGPPVGMLLPSSCMAQKHKYPRHEKFQRAYTPTSLFSTNSDPQHLGA